MNKVIITLAYIGKKGVELKTTSTGKSVATYSIAALKEFSKEKEYDYFNVITWGRDGEWLANNVDRIKKVGVIGRLQTRNYENKEGKKVYITEIVTEKVEVEEWNNEDGVAKTEKTNYEEVTDSSEIPF